MAAQRNKALPPQMGDARVFTRPEVTELLDRVGALSPGTADALDRDTAWAVLRQLQELQHRRRGRAPVDVTCPLCGSSLDADHAQHCGGPPKPPARHPDPIGAAGSAAGAREVARALGQALLSGDHDDSASFWVQMAGPVLWPLLLLAHTVGGDMEGVRLQARPDHTPETLVSVAAALKQLPPGPDADDARSEWASVRRFDERHQRAVFACTVRMVDQWQRPSGGPVSSLRADPLA